MIPSFGHSVIRSFGRFFWKESVGRGRFEFMTKLFRFAAILGILAVAPPALAGDWPTYRGGAARDGYTPDALPAELSLHWMWESSEWPHSAWPRSERMIFDRAFHAVVADGQVYFGRAEPNASLYRARRVPPSPPLPSARFSGTLAIDRRNCRAKSRSCSAIPPASPTTSRTTSKQTE